MLVQKGDSPYVSPEHLYQTPCWVLQGAHLSCTAAVIAMGMYRATYGMYRSGTSSLLASRKAFCKLISNSSDQQESTLAPLATVETSIDVNAFCMCQDLFW